MNDLMNEFEAEVIDIVNAAVKEAFIAGYTFETGYTREEAYKTWIEINE